MKSTVDRNLIGEEKKPNVLQSVCDEKGSCVASAVKVFISILFVYGPLSLVGNIEILCSDWLQLQVTTVIKTQLGSYLLPELVPYSRSNRSLLTSEILLLVMELRNFQ